MTHATRIVAAGAVLVALAAGVPVQAQNPELDGLRERAEQGDAEAQFRLGRMYDHGVDVPKDPAETVRWYRLAAEQGDADAQYNLGVSYANGRGVPQNDVQAHMWFNLAASRSTGDLREDAVENRNTVAARMTAEQLAEAQRLAREWDEAHPR